MEESKEQKVWVSMSETIKTGDYENIKIEAGFNRTYDKESPIELLEHDITEVSKVLKKKAKKIRRRSKRRDY